MRETTGAERVGRGKLRIRQCLLALLLCLSTWHGGAAFAAQIWFEDSNLGEGGGMPPDFVDKFRHPETFAQATKYMNVYLLRINVLRKMDDDFFTTLLFPYLEKNNIKLALNSGGATFYGTTPRRQQVFDEELDLLRRLKRLGGRVDYISLQSILSKPQRRGRNGQEPSEFSLDDRIRGAVEFSRHVREIYPDISIGIIDALPAHGKDYKQPYRQLVTTMKEAGFPLSYVHLDMPFEIPRSARRGGWNAIREVERYIEDDLKLQFGLFVTSRQGGRTSGAAFRDAVLSMIDCYAGLGGSPREYVLASWFKYPDRTIPETGNDYPAMRTLLEFGAQLHKIESHGRVWAGQRSADPQWERQCGVGRQ